LQRVSFVAGRAGVGDDVEELAVGGVGCLAADSVAQTVASVASITNFIGDAEVEAS
jgi:hypothetical protein